jgi:hypothetical protein
MASVHHSCGALRGGELLPEIILDPNRDYRPLWSVGVHHAPRHLSTMPRDITVCERGDSNPHVRRHRLLRPARLPIPPLSPGAIVPAPGSVHRGRPGLRPGHD